jgi:hypothetical protein
MEQERNKKEIPGRIVLLEKRNTLQREEKKEVETGTIRRQGSRSLEKEQHTNY